MSAPNIKTFLRLAHSYVETLQALLEAPQGVSETQLRERIQKERKRSTSVSHVFQQLKDHGLIEAKAEASAMYELKKRLENLFRELRREQTLSTPKVIQGHLEHIEEQRENVRMYAERGSVSGTQRALDRIDTTLEEIRTLSRNNKEAIVHRVTELRASPTRQTVRERFEVVNELMTDYIKPLERIVETSGAFESLFNRLRITLNQAEQRLADEPAVAREIHSTRARLRRARVDTFKNFEAARDEVEPLFHKQQRDNTLLQGASRLLKTVHHEDLKAIELPDRMRLVKIRIRTLFADDGMRHFLLDMLQYEPGPPDPITIPDPVERSPFLDREDVIQRARSACPIPDALAWLLATYDAVSPRQILAGYRYLLYSSAFRATFASNERTYRHRRYTFTAHPLRLDLASSNGKANDRIRSVSQHSYPS